ncbi:Hypothetical protein A7982_03318 [Minicystis rosea]|nr:Hypothetical protein A7982_03318 [Minicystis rosea]
MFMLGILGGFGHYCLARGLVYAPVSVAAPFIYVQMVVAIVIGYIGRGEVPDRDTAIGALLIVAAGVFLTWKETRR